MRVCRLVQVEGSLVGGRRDKGCLICGLYSQVGSRRRRTEVTYQVGNERDVRFGRSYDSKSAETNSRVPEGPVRSSQIAPSSGSTVI